MNKSILLILALFVMAQSALAQRQVIDKVVAMVGGEIVLLSEVEEQFSLIKAQNPTVQGELRCEIIDQLLTSKLLVNQAKLDSILVAEE
ncbi:MAG: peptidylprolyl isomerase, partial [Bacteroidota bacterium]